MQGLKHVITIHQQQLHLSYYPNFFNTNEAHRIYEFLNHQTEWKRYPIRLFGRDVMQPRCIAYYADADKPYTYSNLKLNPKPWNQQLKYLLNCCNRVYQSNWNAALLNRYNNGLDSMGWHSDDEPELGNDPVIASFSFGITRNIKFRLKSNHKTVYNLPLEHGALLIMHGGTQLFWQHALPKAKSITAARINITFRSIV